MATTGGGGGGGGGWPILIINRMHFYYQLCCVLFVLLIFSLSLALSISPIIVHKANRIAIILCSHNNFMRVY